VSDRDITRPTDLLGRLLGPVGPELTCGECFEHLDRYVELELAGRDADAAVPGMRAHLEGCPACHEDHDSLAALVGSEASRRREADSRVGSDRDESRSE
jgi:hypothetical protein